MKRQLVLIAALLGVPSLASAAPAIDFSTASFTPGGTWPNFNSLAVDNTTFQGIAISGFTYTPSTNYAQGSGYLWLRKNPGDQGLGYCDYKEGSKCGVTNTTGNGDYNELSNERMNEIIRLTRPTGKTWTDIEVSSLDTGGTNSDEFGTFYWSNNATLNLNNTTSFINFSHNTLGWSASEGSIFNYLVAHGFDANAQYIYFRAGKFNGSGVSSNGTNNDYLVWGVNVATPVPEPETFAMLLAGLGMLGFIARRRKQQEATAA